MLKQEVKYTDFDGNDRVAEVYFHITRSKLVENLDLEDELTDIASWFEGETRELTRDEIQRVLNMVVRLMSLAYGVRDGDEFDQDPALFEKFKKTAVYEAFLWSLFEDPKTANDWMMGVLPKDVMQQAKAEAEKRGIQLPQ